MSHTQRPHSIAKGAWDENAFYSTRVHSAGISLTQNSLYLESNHNNLSK